MRLTLPCFTHPYLAQRRSVLKALAACLLAVLVLPLSMPAYAQDQDQADSFWTTFTPSEDTRFIFVSSSEGNDSNSGLSPSEAVKTLDKAESLLRDGYPDWMLLKRGDTWYESLPFWTKSGRAEDEKMVVGAYGDGGERPQIRPVNGANGLQSVGPDLVAHVAFVGLRMEPSGREDDQNPTGIRWLRESDDILFEDLYVSSFRNNITIQRASGVDAVRNIRLNGCVVVDSWSAASHSGGLFASGLDGLLIENSVFASNGFNESRGVSPTIFNHNIYIQNGNKNVTVRSNVIADASSHGLQMRSGGVVEGNLFISNPLAMKFGGGNHPDWNSDGVRGTVSRNLVMYGRGIDASLPRSVGFEISNVSGAEFEGNIFYKSEIDYNGYPIKLDGTSVYGMANILFENNKIIDWYGSVFVKRPEGQNFSNIVFRGNSIFRDFDENAGDLAFNKPLAQIPSVRPSELEFDGNRYYLHGVSSGPFEIAGGAASVSQWVSGVEGDAQVDIDASLPSGLGLDAYRSQLGLGGGMEEFLADARSLSRQHLDPAISPQAVYRWVVQSLANQGLGE